MQHTYVSVPGWNYVTLAVEGNGDLTILTKHPRGAIIVKAVLGFIVGILVLSFFPTPFNYFGSVWMIIFSAFLIWYDFHVSGTRVFTYRHNANSVSVMDCCELALDAYQVEIKCLISGGRRSGSPYTAVCWKRNEGGRAWLVLRVLNKSSVGSPVYEFCKQAGILLTIESFDELAHEELCDMVCVTGNK